MPSGGVPHYRPCLLVWYLMPHCRSCLLARYHCNRHFTVQMKEGWLQVWCYLCRGAITSDMSTELVPPSDMPACTAQLYQTCIRVFVKCFSIRQGLRHAYKVRCHSNVFVILVQYHPGRHIEYIKV